MSFWNSPPLVPLTTICIKYLWLSDNNPIACLGLTSRYFDNPSTINSNVDLHSDSSLLVSISLNMSRFEKSFYFDLSPTVVMCFPNNATDDDTSGLRLACLIVLLSIGSRVPFFGTGAFMIND